MNRVGRAAFALVCLVAGCARTSDGVPVAADQRTTAASSAASTPSVVATPSQQSDDSVFGIVPTEKTPVPPNTVACSQPVKPTAGMIASVADPAAPKITVAAPEGWSMSAGSGEIGGQLAGPDGMSATVRITATRLDPAAAFKKYADDLMEESPVSSVSVLPGELCGYSGQKLMGAWSATPQNAVEFEDRIVHVWTNSGNNYLVAVHVQAPTGRPGFDAAASLLTDDFEIVLP
jgi:hypothetical protein